MENEEAPKKGKQQATAEESVTAPEGPVIYCGPTLPGGVLMQFAVYQGMPAYLQATIKACPAIQRLIVPVEKLNVTLARMQEKGSAEHTWAAEITAYIQGGV